MYQLHFSLSAKKYLQKSNQTKRIKAKLLILALNPQDQRLDVKKMKSSDHFLRLRIGDARVIYQVGHKDRIIRIVEIDNRGDIY
jgi:mRNA-degrading endonuclease RelE of RelBE toxin-antitoxin system